MQLLEGVHVLDLTNVLAGPFCCYQLVQLGAAPPLNKNLMGASFLAQNAGKRSVTINLKDPDGKGHLPAARQTNMIIIEPTRVLSLLAVLTI